MSSNCVCVCLDELRESSTRASACRPPVGGIASSIERAVEIRQQSFDVLAQRRQLGELHFEFATPSSSLFLSSANSCTRSAERLAASAASESMSAASGRRLRQFLDAAVMPSSAAAKARAACAGRQSPPSSSRSSSTPARSHRSAHGCAGRIPSDFSGGRRARWHRRRWRSRPAPGRCRSRGCRAPRKAARSTAASRAPDEPLLQPCCLGAHLVDARLQVAVISLRPCWTARSARPR